MRPLAIAWGVLAVRYERQKVAVSLAVALTAALVFTVVAYFAFAVLGGGLGILVDGSFVPAAMPVGIAALLVYQRVRFGSIGRPSRQGTGEAQLRPSGLGVAWAVAFVAYCVVGLTAVVVFEAGEWVWGVVGLSCVVVLFLVRNRGNLRAVA
jgi:hypothetical protein